MQRFRYLTQWFRDVHRARATRRASAAERGGLARELASYTSRSDLDELDAILARHDDNETAEIRMILQRTPIRA